MNELEYRSAEVTGVSFPDRTIELIVMPYERETEIPWAGRMIREVCSRGAFDGIERRANRVKVNRAHNLERTVGKAVAFYPNREEGLVAQVKIFSGQPDIPFPEADQTLLLAAQGGLDASAGFAPMPGGEQWENNRSRRRLTKLWLGHIAMVPDPAYEDATVLAVRNAERPVAAVAPNLAQLELARLEAQYAAIDARYRVG